MPKAVATFEVYCSECGAGLCRNAANRKYEENVIDISPCEACIKSARDEGYEEGYKEGVEEGEG